MEVWLVAVGIVLAAQAYWNRRSIMGQLDDVKAAIAEARAEFADDIAKVTAKVEALQISQAEKDAIIADIQGFGTGLDALAGDVDVVPEPTPEPAPEPEPTPET